MALGLQVGASCPSTRMLHPDLHPDLLTSPVLEVWLPQHRTTSHIPHPSPGKWRTLL